jgi:hypothetical protein
MINPTSNLALLCLVTAAAAKPVAAVPAVPAVPDITSSLSPGDQACLRVRDQSIAQRKADPDSIPTVPAKDAYDCLNALAFNQTSARLLLDSLKPFYSLQTTLSYVKDPPAEVSCTSLTVILTGH